MNNRSSISPFAVLGLCLAAGTALAQKTVMRWVDADGVVHYGDSIPPEYADRDRALLNEQGVEIGFVQGEITAEERAEAERIAAEAERVRQEKERAARRDQMLLDTYLAVSDIEDLRDRRLELINSQIKVTEFYLSNLRKRLDALDRDRHRFAPLNTDEDAQPMPEFLVLDISRVEASIALYEERLARSRSEQQKLKNEFSLDIERFKELKGG